MVVLCDTGNATCRTCGKQRTLRAVLRMAIITCSDGLIVSVA